MTEGALLLKDTHGNKDDERRLAHCFVVRDRRGTIHGVQALILEQFVSSSRGTPERPPSTHASNLVY